VATDGPRRWALTLRPHPAPKAPPPAVVAAPLSAPEAGPGTRRILAWSALGIGALGLGLGVHQTISAADLADQGANPGAGDADRQARLRRDLDSATLGMGLGYGLGSALVGTGVALLLWPDGTEAPSAAVSAGPGGAVIGGRF
jgi:hypothetical protein